MDRNAFWYLTVDRHTLHVSAECDVSPLAKLNICGTVEETWTLDKENASLACDDRFALYEPWLDVLMGGSARSVGDEQGMGFLKVSNVCAKPEGSETASGMIDGFELLACRFYHGLCEPKCEKENGIVSGNEMSDEFESLVCHFYHGLYEPRYEKESEIGTETGMSGGSLSLACHFYRDLFE